MKTLQESLFDKDLIKRDPLKSYMDDFSSDALEKLSSEERNFLFDQLFESGKKLNAAGLKNNPIDLTENILMVRRDGLHILSEMDYPMKYNFIFQLEMGIEESDIRAYVSALINSGRGTYYYWDRESLSRFDKAATWKGKIASIHSGDESYSIISKKEWVHNIIEGILLD